MSSIQEEFNLDEQTWDIIDSTFEDDDALITHQLSSFNNMMDTIIPMHMQHKMPLVVNSKTASWKFRIVRCGMSKPVQYQKQGYQPMLPSEARNRNLTYAAPLFVDYEFVFTNSESPGMDIKVVETRVCVGKIPIMVGSKYCHLYGRSRSERVALNECPNDRGGYFIISGSEKVIVSQERPRENAIMCFKEVDQSKPNISRVEVKSTIDQRFFPIKVTIIKLTKYQDAASLKKKDDGTHPGHKLMLYLPYAKRPVPLFILFKAMGVVVDKDIFSYLVGDEQDQEFINMLIPSALDAHYVTTQADAIRYISNSINITISESTVQAAVEKDAPPTDMLDRNTLFRMKYTKDLLNREFLPHVGNDPVKKLRFVSLMVKRLLKARHDPTLYSDRDKLTNKRLDLPGTLLAQIFRYYFQKMIKDIKTMFVNCAKHDKDVTTGGHGLSQEIRRIIQKSNIQNKVNYALSTGNWFTNRSQANSAAKKGVAQVLSRLAYQGTLSHLRRVTSPLERAGSKHEPPRRYHGTQPPKICPNETPEGTQVGSVKNLSLMTHVSIEVSAQPAIYCLKKLGMIETVHASSEQIHMNTTILVNGDFVGVTENLAHTVRLYTLMRYLKRTGTLCKYVSISWHQDRNHLKIMTDGGRYSVPYYIVDEDNHFQMDVWMEAYKAEKKGMPNMHNGISGQDTCLTGRLPADHEAKVKGYRSYNRVYESEEYEPWCEAAIEYLDTDEEETAMIAVTPDQLYDGQTFRHAGGFYYGNLTRAVDLSLDLNPSRASSGAADLAQIRKIEDDAGLSPELLQRRTIQDERFAKKAKYAATPLRKRILDKLSGPSVAVFERCIKDVVLLGVKGTTGPKAGTGWKGADLKGANNRKIKLILKEERKLTPADISFLTNINRFISSNYVRYTHCLMHPAIINGVVAGNIPFSDHNQSPRNCYQSSMGKQAIGIFATNYNQRMDTMASVMIYPQKPLVATRISKHTRMERLHHGFNVMCAIATYTGYNQEDSLIGAKATAERGGFTIAYFRTYTSKLQNQPSLDATESFEVPPDRTIGRKVGAGGTDRYHAIVRNFNKKSKSHLGKPELPAIGSIVRGGDIIIPKSKKVMGKKKDKTEAEALYTDCSVTVRPAEAGVVDLVIPNEDFPNNDDEDAYRFVKARLCEKRETEIGDKFASRHAQKGTEGIQLSPADMMMNHSGISPDKILNPQAIPSRMTEGQLLESICAKEGVTRGVFHDATPFTHFNLEEIREDLGRTGHDDACDEIMYNGMTGEPLEIPVTFWPTYYQRLKHMVGDKMHSRAMGPIQALTKQPAEGRARQGGLRMGEMERDCMIAHGCAQYLKEKLVDSSDIFEFFVSQKRQTVIAANPKMGIYQHGTQDIYEEGGIYKVHMPYAMNLFRNELRTAMVDMRLVLE